MIKIFRIDKDNIYIIYLSTNLYGLWLTLINDSLRNNKMSILCIMDIAYIFSMDIFSELN